MRIGLLVIVVLGGGARLAWAWRTAEPPTGLHDPAFYLMLASMLAAGRGYAYLGPEGGATAYYRPGYPALVAAAIWLTDRPPLLEPSDFAVAVALNVALSTATIALVFALARRLVDVRVGLAAAALVAAWPNLIFH